MKRGRFSEEQIVGILKEHEAGRKMAELAREHGVSEGTLYGWKSKYGGMEVGEAQRLRSRHMLAWCVERQIELANIEPGKPSQNGRLESLF